MKEKRIYDFILFGSLDRKEKRKRFLNILFILFKCNRDVDKIFFNKF